MNKLFGANWLTSTLGIVEKVLYTLATFILAYPDSVKAIINPTYHLWYGVGVLLLGFIFGGAKDVHTKDKSVTGGTVQNDPPALKPGDPGIKTVVSVLLAVACAGSLLFVTACANSGAFNQALATTVKKIGVAFAKVETPQAVQVEATLATSAALAQVNKADQADTAQWCACISRGVRQFSGSTVPSADALQAAIEQQSGPIDNPSYKILISSFCAVWGAVVPSLEATHPNAQTTAAYLNAAATGVDTASTAYLASNPSK